MNAQQAPHLGDGKGGGQHLIAGGAKLVGAWLRRFDSGPALAAANGQIAAKPNTFNACGLIAMPVVVSVFPGEIFRAPKSWAQRCYTNLTSFNEATDDGHFAAWEQPALFAQEVRAAFRPLR